MTPSTPLPSGDGAALAEPTLTTDWLAVAREASARASARAADDDHPGGFPAESLRDLHACGLLLAPAERTHGGAGLAGDPAQAHLLYAVLTAIGRGSLPLGRLYEGHVNALALVEAYGTDAQRRRAARDAAEGRLFGVWNTEIPSQGVRLHPLPGGRVRMEGAKTFCSGAGRVDRILTTGALPDGGWQMVVVPTDRVETRAEPETWCAEGMRATASGRVDFSGAVLKPDDVLGAPGDYTREPYFNGGAVRFAAVQLGGAEALAAAAADHLRRLDRTGALVQQLRLGTVAVALETGRLWMLGAARLGLSGADEDVVAYAQAARTAVERVCLDVLERVDRAVGARGMLPPCAVERVGRDLRLYLRQPNPDGALAAVGAAFLDRHHPGQGSDV